MILIFKKKVSIVKLTRNLKQGGNVCLADYCDILGCNSSNERFDSERRSSKCSDSLMQQTRFECYAYFKTCFPSPQPKDQEKMIDTIQNMYCNRFYCLHENSFETQLQDPSQVSY